MNRTAYSHDYRQAAYPQPVPTYSHSPPIPAPHYLPQPMDRDTFRQFFAARLATLMLNSRPIIQELSIIAANYAKMADIVAQCLESHIRVVPPSNKLPALYLLDAIAKNVPVPYATVLAQHVATVFIEAYESVDNQTKYKMEEMLTTWRTGSPAHREVFGVIPQHNIEKYVAAKHSSTTQPTHQNVAMALHGSAPKMLTKSQILSEIDVLIAQKQQTLNVHPDQNTAIQVETLKQLHSVVRTTDISQNELMQIFTQLRSFNASVQHSQPRVQHVAPVAPLIPVLAPSSTVSNELRSFLSGLAPAVLPADDHSSAPPLPSIVKLINSDTSSRAVTPITGTPLGARAIATQMEGSSMWSDPKVEAYARDIMTFKLKPNQSAIARDPAPLLSFIYGSQSYQCSRCALRFPDRLDGKQRLQDHFDLHFKQTDRGNQQNMRGYSRCWYMGLQNWVKDSKTAQSKSDSQNDDTLVKRQEELKNAFVIVPSGEEAKPTTCPICKEIIKPEFRDEDEEWIWKNAVRYNGKVYHATCQADATATPASYLQRIKHESESRSRSGTPDVQSHSLPTSGLLQQMLIEASASSMKRKSSDSDALLVSSLSNEELHPAKRLALAPPQ